MFRENTPATRLLQSFKLKFDLVRNEADGVDEFSMRPFRKGEPSIVYDKHGHPYNQIVATRDVREGVKAGDKGGFIGIDAIKTLLQDRTDSSWIFPGGIASADTRLRGNATLFGEAHDSKILGAGTVGPGAYVENSIVKGVVGSRTNIINCDITAAGKVADGYQVSNYKVVDDVPPGTKTMQNSGLNGKRGTVFLALDTTVVRPVEISHEAPAPSRVAQVVETGFKALGALLTPKGGQRIESEKPSW